jgi:hypothetical protein
MGNLPHRMAVFRELEREAQRTTRLDVCVVRNRTEWLDEENRDDQLAELDDLGVDWLVMRPRGATCDEILDGIAELREMVGG